MLPWLIVFKKLTCPNNAQPSLVPCQTHNLEVDVVTLHCAANAKGYVSKARNQNGGIVHFGYLNGVDKGAFLVVIAHSANKATKVLHTC